MRLFPVSATKRSPLGPSARAEGVLKDAADPTPSANPSLTTGQRRDVSIGRNLANAITLASVSNINSSVFGDRNTKGI